jgi:hypothetical protein
VIPKICYVPRNFRGDYLDVISQANQIITEYQAQGYSLTLRQLYYQFVSRDLIPNTMKEYTRLGNIISSGRLAGLIDWNAITDRTRNLEKPAYWASPQELIEIAADQFNIDMWARQHTYTEVWVEKEAMAGIIERACRPFDVPWFCCRGYTSQSEMWEAAMRLERKRNTRSRNLKIIHLGDHDPSGMDMTRDIEDRMITFGVKVRVHRIALNMDQVEEHNPPPNPAKQTDARFEAYQEQFGTESWELDALQPQVLNDLITAAIRSDLDQAQWDTDAAGREKQRTELLAAARYWEEVTEHMDGMGFLRELAFEQNPESEDEPE